MKAEDITLIETVFSEYRKFDYSPIVLYSNSDAVHQFIWDMLHSNQIGIINCDMKHIATNAANDIAITNIEEATKSIELQTALIKMLDSQKEKHHNIFLTTHHKVNDMNLIGRLRARLLSGVYIEV